MGTMHIMDDGGSNGDDARDLRKGSGPADLQGLAGMLGIPQLGRDALEPRGAMGMDGRGAARSGGSGPKLETVSLTGEARLAAPGTTSAPATVTLDDTGVTLQVGGDPAIRAGYRDLSLIAIQQATALLVLGYGPDAMRWMLARFGDRLGPLVRELRERRLKQRLTDGLVEVPGDPAELVEFDWKPTSQGLGPGPDGPAVPAAGVGQLVEYPWGLVVAPIDERVSWIRYRRAAIARVTLPSPGNVVVDGAPGQLTLRGLGPGATRFHDRIQKLRDGAYADAAGFVEQLLPDAPFGVRQKASALLVDGRPTRPDEFGDAGWPIVETAVLGEPTFADSYESLSSSAGPAAPRWVAMSPVDPGGTEPKIWFLIAMPGNLVALELVSAGAHATYFYRVMPRAQYKGEPPERLGLAAEQAVRDVSEALVDCRFLREPMALPADQLRLPKYLRYRLALAVLPTLAWARARFVARIVHKDSASWSAAVADLVRWHSTAGDEAAEWPGRSAQEAQVSAAEGDGEPDYDAGGSGEPSSGGGEGSASAEAGSGGEPAAQEENSKPSGPLG